MRELSAEEVYKKADLSYLNAKTSNDIEPLNSEIVKQERAEKSINFGINVNSFGYNIFVSGESSSRKRSFLREALTEAAKKKEIPNDLCYIYNFDDKTKPLLISLPAGVGDRFKNSMEEFSEYIKTEINLLFKSTNYQKEIELFLQKYDDELDDLIEEYEEKLKELKYSFIQADNGVLQPAPIDKEGELLDQKTYDELTEEEQAEYQKNRKSVDIILIDYNHQYETKKKEMEEKRKDIDKILVGEFIKEKIKELKDTYSKYDRRLEKYFDSIYDDILDNLSDYKETEETPQNNNIIQIVSGNMPKKEVNHTKYKINVLVDNKDKKHAPVVFVDELDPSEFFGFVEFNVEGQSIHTDFTKIKSGSLIEANGGFLVLRVEDLFKYLYLWDRFKTVLKSKKVKIQTRLYRDLVLSNTLKSEEIPIDIKVVLIGDYYWYNLLSTHDPEFQELFRVHALFESDTNRTKDTEVEYAQFISKYIKENDLKPFTLTAIERVIEYSSRISDSKEKLSLSYNEIYKLINEANAWAEVENEDIVNLSTVEKAIKEKEYRVGFVEERYLELIKNGTYLISTEGEKIGEINALSVLDYGDFRTGRPNRLTANTYRGTEGVISIDRNVKMSGKLHDKAVETVRGFLGKTFGQKRALSLVANVTFEQNYGGIDGDSATSTTLYAILSDLAQVPIKQNLAVTGSMNQKGEVQVVGGINEKIEGFFKVCKAKGLTGGQGVIIPEANTSDLMLSKEVREAIAKGQFHIYTVNNIQEGIELLTGVSFKEIVQRVEGRLEEILEGDKKDKK